MEHWYHMPEYDDGTLQVSHDGDDKMQFIDKETNVAIVLPFKTIVDIAIAAGHKNVSFAIAQKICNRQGYTVKPMNKWF